MNWSFYLFSLRSSDHTEWTLQFSSCSNRIEDEAEKRESASENGSVCLCAWGTTFHLSWLDARSLTFYVLQITSQFTVVRWNMCAVREGGNMSPLRPLAFAWPLVISSTRACHVNHSSKRSSINPCMHGRVIKTWNSLHTVRRSVVEKMTSIIFDSQSLCSSLGKVDYLIHVGTFRAELSVPSNLVNVLVKRTHDILTQ